MKKLSVIIVNYNVSYFLEQALMSVRKAAEHLSAEVFVVDNNSVDGSVEMVKAKFPEIILIANKQNVGFSKANNQAIRLAQGEYILLLNPDTVVEEDTFIKCCNFMDQHPDGGGLGVKMVDGKGKFLPESKRGLPTPWVAFYKIFGLAAFFPKSRKFGRYHLGYLPENEVNEIEVLSGAFMLMRKSALDKVGLLDEDYFMYGEDIDLSYRITQGGYKNYYLPKTRIIHYKGESTKRTSINYVFVFYRAMIIFAQKHFSNKHAGLFSMLIHLAIYLRAGISIASRFAKQSLLPLLDATAIFIGMYFLKEYWEENHKHVPGEYPIEFMTIAVPGYIIVWLLSVYFNGGYEKPVKPRNIMWGIALGTILIAAFSNFLDTLRFSKALIILGGAYSVFSMIGIRLVIHFIKYRNVALGTEKSKRVIVVGHAQESSRVVKLMRETAPGTEVLGYVSPYHNEVQTDAYLGEMQQVEEIIKIYGINEIIFCSKDMPAHEIIEWMTSIDSRSIDYKIIPDNSDYIIGSNSKGTQGDFYTINIEMAIVRNSNIRNKRMFDIALSLFLLLVSPILIILLPRPSYLFKNIFRVLSGRYSWVGYAGTTPVNLPKIRKGILNPATGVNKDYHDNLTLHRLDMLYAKNYRIITDLNIIFKSFRKIGS